MTLRFFKSSSSIFKMDNLGICKLICNSIHKVLKEPKVLFYLVWSTLPDNRFKKEVKLLKPDKNTLYKCSWQ